MTDASDYCCSHVYFKPVVSALPRGVRKFGKKISLCLLHKNSWQHCSTNRLSYCLQLSNHNFISHIINFKYSHYFYYYYYYCTLIIMPITFLFSITCFSMKNIKTLQHKLNWEYRGDNPTKEAFAFLFATRHLSPPPARDRYYRQFYKTTRVDLVG